MAYVEVDNKERFSLLLLEPGEIYFEDYSVYCYPGGFPEEEAVKRKQKGRLKICSKSLVFDPSDINKPLLKFPLKECTVIDKWTGSLLSKLDSKGNVLCIVCNQIVEIEGSFIAPYRFKRERQSYLFTLNFISASACLPQILQLKRASTLPGAEQAGMSFVKRIDKTTNSTQKKVAEEKLNFLFQPFIPSGTPVFCYYPPGY